MRGVVFALEDLLLRLPGARETLQRCFARYRMGLVSTTGRTGPEVQRALAELDLAGYFETWATTADLGDDRRRVVSASLSAMGVQCADAAMVTTDPETLAAANAAGCRGVVVAAGMPPVLARTDRTALSVASFFDVPEALEALQS